MRNYVVIFIMLLNTSSAIAQQETFNRLKYKLSVSTTDSSRCMILDSLSMNYMFFSEKSDSTFYYGNDFINTAFSMTDKKYLTLAYAHLGFYYINIAKIKEALNMSFKGLSLSEQNNIPDYQSALYYDMSWVYFNMGDYTEGLKNAFKGISYLKENKDPFFDQALHLNGIIGDIYMQTGKIDSAEYYFRLVDSIAVSSKELSAKEISAYYWSNYYLYYKRDYNKADSIIHIGITNCKKNGDMLLNYFYIYSSKSRLYQGKINEAIGEAHKAYSLSLKMKDPAGLSYAADILNASFEKAGNRDSAYYYLHIQDSLKDVMQKNGNANEIQQIRFDRQLNKKEEEAALVLQNQKNRNKLTVYVFITALLFFLIIAAIQWRNNKHRKKANILLQEQKDKAENTLTELKATQSQLIQSEKMASLGELTAGIAHEIQNPLNFVNNFSEINTELIEEMKTEMRAGNNEEAIAIADDIKANEEKINHHGKRADAIVKGMLQHSGSGSGVKEPTDINKLTDEYLRLSYHGLRAKDKSFNATIKTDFDNSIGNINIIPQDIGRVILNLLTNAFYAVQQKQKEVASIEMTSFEKMSSLYEPTVTVTTKKENKKIVISVTDNGKGIPQKTVDKIFQPFFTTKPTGQGTGLGLSMSYDIVTKGHGGEIKVETEENNGSVFTITLPKMS